MWMLSKIGKFFPAMKRRPQRFSHLLPDNFLGEGLMEPGAHEIVHMSPAAFRSHAVSRAFNAATRLHFLERMG